MQNQLFLFILQNKGGKNYYNDALQKKQLVVSAQTAFDVDYLFELTNLVEQCSANFEALAKVYNRQHNMKLPMDVMGRRDELYIQEKDDRGVHPEGLQQDVGQAQV